MFKITMAVVAAITILTGCSSRKGDVEKNFHVNTGSSKVSVSINDRKGLASAEGIWFGDGGKVADPINKSKILCKRSERSCEENMVWISTDVTDRSTLWTTDRFFQVTSWTTNKVVAISNGMCASTEITLSKSDNSAIAVIRRTARCFDQPSRKLEGPRYQRLISGKEFDGARKK
ncbi:MAG: hypothetical protein EOP17_00215 [Rhizobiaceae bacterium]|nr:MAG: hypothetical protein EOP17_00215 [Rhizobiaceae bacterium]